MGFGDLGRGLDAGQPATADRDGAPDRGDVGQPVGETLPGLGSVERVGVLLDPGYHAGIGSAADGVHQGVVRQ